MRPGAEPGKAAQDDAMALLGRYDLPRGATIELNDDAVLSIEWERGGHGVLLVFPGDGTASYATRDGVLVSSVIYAFSYRCIPFYSRSHESIGMGEFERADLNDRDGNRGGNAQTEEDRGIR